MKQSDFGGMPAKPMPMKPGKKGGKPKGKKGGKKKEPC